tara:strand:+ start:793 stop:1563 length:771 start_codon:yes stop_codon:yes gene_type:complete
MSSASTSTVSSGLNKGMCKNFTLNKLFRNNGIIAICVVIIILVVFLGYKFSTSFMSSNGLKRFNKLKNNLDNNNSGEEKFKIVTPQCVYGALKTTESKSLVVNVLSDKMPVFIGVEGPDETKSVSKVVFEAMLTKNNGQVPKELNMVILMCAGWSCGAAKNYYNELVERGVNVRTMVDYAGGLHEWCLYNKINKNVFKLFSLRKPEEQNISELSPQDATGLMQNTAHGYKTNTMIETGEAPLEGLCKLGIDMPKLL